MSAFSLPLFITMIVVALLTAGGMAVRSVSRIWLRHWAERRLRGAAAAAAYLERPHRLLTAANTGVAFTLLVSGMLAGIVGDGRESKLGALWDALILAATAVVFGQLIPRAIARRWPIVVAPLILPVLQLADLVTRPVIAAGHALARLFVRERPETKPSEDRDIIQDLLREGELEGVGEREEIAIISGVVEFSEKVVREVMTPRSDVFALPDGMDAHTLAVQIAQSGYSRVPVYHETLDNVLGMVHAFDVIKAHGAIPAPLRLVGYTAPDAPCNELLFRMLRDRVHLAIVRDDKAGGRMLGLVTLEDLLEELVGDIRDEHDEPEPPRPAK
jgi:putative hemolysin